MQVSVATKLGHPDYPGHLVTFCVGQKESDHYKSDPDPKYSGIMRIEQCNLVFMKRLLLSN